MLQISYLTYSTMVCKCYLHLFVFLTFLFYFIKNDKICFVYSPDDIVSDLPNYRAGVT